MKIAKSNKNIKKKILITTVIVVVLAAIVLLCLFFTPLGDNLRNKENTQDTNSPRPVNQVDYKGPTQQDAANSQNAKEKLLEGDSNEAPIEPTAPSNQEQKKPAPVNISYADIINGNLEVRASTSSVIQGNGTCTVTVSKAGGTPIVKTTPAFIDVSSTICEPVYIPRSQLTTGSWTVTVTYSSPTHQGSSGAYNLEVK